MSTSRAPEVRCAVIPTAGRGTRLRHLAGDGPKALLHVGNAPMIFYALADVMQAGIRDIVIVTAPGTAEIQRTLESADSLDDAAPAAWGRRLGACTVRFVTQPEPRGLADAVACAAPLLGNEPFVLFLPDNVFAGGRTVTTQLLETYADAGRTTLGMTPVTADTAGGFGNCGAVTFEPRSSGTVRITHLGDKGTGSFAGGGAGWRTCGASIQTCEFLEINRTLDPNAGGEWDDVPIFQQLARAGRLYGRQLTDVTCYDAGNPAGFTAAHDAEIRLAAPAENARV